MHHSGLGFDVYVVAARWGSELVTGLYKGVTIITLIWTATVCLSKVSILLMYTSVIPNRSMLLICRGIGVFIVMWAISGFAAAALVCRPFTYNWEMSIEGVEGTCGSQNKFYFAMGMINVILDTVLIGLPMPYLYRLRMPWKKKLVAMSLFGLGIT